LKKSFEELKGQFFKGLRVLFFVPGEMYGCITTGHFSRLLRSRAAFKSVNDLVMSEEKNNRDNWLHLRLTESEYNKIHEAFSKTTKKKLSEYARSVLLNRPITVYTRNQSFDLFVAELIQLKNELNAIGNNFNQTVKKLHTIDHDEEIKLWIERNEKSKEQFFKKVEEINQKINQVSDKWLHG